MNALDLDVYKADYWVTLKRETRGGNIVQLTVIHPPGHMSWWTFNTDWHEVDF